MTALVRVRGVALAVPRNKADQRCIRRFLTEIFSSLENQSRWEQILRDYIAQGQHVEVSTYLLSAIELRVASLRKVFLRKALADGNLRAALLLREGLQDELALLEATPHQLIAA
jgi:hypothetical protein